MTRTRTLKNQHDLAERLVGDLLAACEDQIDDTRAFRISLMLAKLTGLLRIHFAQEDEVLYPLMERSSDATTASTAAEFRAEMGGLGATYMAFADRWTSSRKIAGEFAAFKAEAEAVFAALADRIHRENEQLYPLADQIGDQERNAA